jgi:hypothetical protein
MEWEGFACHANEPVSRGHPRHAMASPLNKGSLSAGLNDVEIIFVLFEVVQKYINHEISIFQNTKLAKQKSAEALIGNERSQSQLRVNNSTSEVIRRSKLPRSINVSKSQ